MAVSRGGKPSLRYQCEPEPDFEPAFDPLAWLPPECEPEPDFEPVSEAEALPPDDLPPDALSLWLLPADDLPCEELAW